ncbi:MAG TPA: hypothetical protein EYH56_03510 [Nanoarchaeota archaeon]|nr:hypothetical protein [Nanoarchaeota archaeon]
MKRRKYNQEKPLFLLFSLVMFLLGFSFANMLYTINKLEMQNVKIVEKKIPIYITKSNYNSTTLYLLAVDQEGEGVVIPLKVEVRPGTGKVLANIENLLFWIDTQHSLQIARDIAANITGRDPESFDVIYTLESNASIVGGPSAGAAFAIATIAALKNITLNNSVLITGTINEDGTIGEVGGIYEKAEAAKKAGAKIVLVPPGQATEIKLVPEEKCITRPGFIFCETIYKRKKINISEKIGIEIKEVSNIYEAMKYFFGERYG